MLIALDISESFIFAPVLTAPATILSCLNSNCKVVPVDADPETFSLNIDDLQKKISKYKSTRKGAIIVVHVGGIIDPKIHLLQKIARENNLFLIEDCAHAFGSTLNNEPAGIWGDAAIYSFFLTKTVTSGEGGCVVGKDRELIESIKRIRNYGKDNEGKHVIRGSSWRMNEFTAALLYGQLKSYFEVKKELRENVSVLYDRTLDGKASFQPYKLHPSTTSGYYKYIVCIREGLEFSYDEFHCFMKENDILLPARVFDRITIEEPYLHEHISLICDGNFEIAKRLCANHFCLPIYESLTKNEILYVCEKVNEYFANIPQN